MREALPQSRHSERSEEPLISLWHQKLDKKQGRQSASRNAASFLCGTRPRKKKQKPWRVGRHGLEME
jgi:hypothetical protein